MFKSTLIVVLVYIIHSTESNSGLVRGPQIAASQRAAFELGGGWNGGHASAEISASGGGGISISGIIKWILSLIKRIFGVPIKIPLNILATIKEILADIFTLNFSGLVKLPFEKIGKVVSSIFGGVKGAVKGIFGVLVKIKDLNAEVIGAITSKIEAILGVIIKTLAGIDIFGIKTFYNIAMWLHDRVDQVTLTICNIIVWVATKVVNGVSGAVKISHIQDILKLPVIKQIVELIKKVHSWKRDQIAKNLTKFGNFVGSIIYQHKGFFLPIFNWILNLITAFNNAWNTLKKGGNFQGILKIVGNVKKSFEPMIPKGLSPGDFYKKVCEYLKKHVGVSDKGGKSGASGGGSFGGSGSFGKGASFGGSGSFKFGVTHS